MYLCIMKTEVNPKDTTKARLFFLQDVTAETLSLQSTKLFYAQLNAFN